MNISMANSPLSVLTQHCGKGLKSTEEKIERFQKTQSQIDFFEGKKAELKNKHCTTMEEIEEKLELFNNYNDQIDAVKKQFNQEQVMHCMDEAKELGEKIAEAAEKLEPKTAEERRKELVEEALGIEDEGGILDELLEDMPEEALQETLDEMLTDGMVVKEELDEELPEIVEQEKLTQMYLERQYTPIDIKA
ncbi:MAG: hypothetical protein K2H91_11900 [Lachnospiraceae bacterium]|nr:hypothetical protein [Lachnospiraceae bacterium]